MDKNILNNVVKTMVRSEMEEFERHGEKIRLRCQGKRRIKRAVCSILLFFLMIGFGKSNGLDTAFSVQISLVLLVPLGGLYLLFTSRNNEGAITDLAIKSPDTPIAQLIMNEMVTEEDLALNRRVVRIIMAVLLLMLVIGAVNLPYETKWEYKEYGEGYKIAAYEQSVFDFTGEIVVPSEYHGKAVVAIGDRAFYRNLKLRKVVLPDTVTEIGESAFKGCSRLESIELSENLVSLKEACFSKCKRLKEVILPDTVTEMGAAVFKDCSALENVKLSKNLVSMEGACFVHCKSLREIVLPDTLLELRGESFYGCTNLQSVTLPKYITEIKGNTFQNCKSLESIHIPTGVRRIGAHAFEGCSKLHDVDVPYTVKEIGSSAFRECSSLKEIELPSGVEVDERAFQDTPVRFTGPYAFEYRFQ